MDITDYIQHDLINLNLKARNKEDAIRELAQLMENTPAMGNMTAENIFEVFYWTHSGGKKYGRPTSIQCLAKLIGWINAKQLYPEILAYFFITGNIVMIICLGNPHKGDRRKI